MLDFEPWPGGLGSHEICPACGIHFGYNDASDDLRPFIYAEWRREWNERGCHPFSGDEWQQVAAAVIKAAKAKLRTR
jgi:hypothetical protein